jgi:choline dehydrogenase-like flavoprotein
VTARRNGAEAEVYDVDVVVVGAGPVGLTLANILGLQGVRTLVLEERTSLIDYPRGVGLDDESLRTFQAIGLVDQILPHTVPNQILRFVDAKRRVLAEMAPPDARFGWPKRNGFVQPSSMPNCSAVWTASTTSRSAGPIRWSPAARPPMASPPKAAATVTRPPCVRAIWSVATVDAAPPGG